MSDDRTVCHTPTPGKKPTSVPTWKYELLRKAILQVVPRGLPGIAAMSLADRVRPLLTEDERSRLGSVMWHVTTVKLHLETIDELRRDPDRKPQHIYRP